METIKIPMQHWITYLFGRVGDVWSRKKRRICTLKQECKSFLECFYQKVGLFVNLCFDRKEYSSGFCTLVYLISKYLRNDRAAVVFMAHNELCPFQGTKQCMRTVLGSARSC